MARKKNKTRSNERRNANENCRTYRLWPETGKILGLGRNATYAAADNGEIPGAIKIGGRWLVMKAPLESFLAGAPRTAA